MLEMYLMIFLCVVISLFIGFAAVTVYLGYVLIMHDLEKKKKMNRKSYREEDETK